MVVALACGGGGGNPAGSSATPAATATSDPTATTDTVTPTPTPSPSPTPHFGTSCDLGFVPDDVVDDCSRDFPSFLDEVDQAINQLVQTNPEIFDLTDQRGGGGYRILSIGRYYVGVVENLEAMGFCAMFDGEEVAVKNTNDFNDQYDIELSTGHIRRGEGSYTATCNPATFPKQTASLPPTPGCSLPPSHEMACGREDPRLLGEVDSAIQELIDTRPDIFDTRNTAPSTDFPFVLDENAYIQGLVEILTRRGLCARWDGEEIQVKNTNEFNDQIDVLLSTGHVWRGLGSYRSTCYPAAF